MKNPSSKGKEYKLSLIKDKIQRLYSRLLKKIGVIEDLLYTGKNKGVAEKIWYNLMIS